MGAAALDRQSLERELRERLEGDVRFDDGSRALYASDASNYRHVPIGVVIPRTEEDVVAAVAACRRHGAPVLARGAGTSLCGQGCNVAVVLDFTKHLDRILELDVEQRCAWVQPGLVLDTLRDEAARHDLTFAPDPATHNHNTLGGMIGNNSCGPHSVMGGTTVENVLALDILTADGERFIVGPTDKAGFVRIQEEGGRRAQIYRELRALADDCADAVRERFPDIPRRVSGFNLDALLPEHGFDVARALVGSEGTCAVVLRAKLRLVPRPPVRVLAVLGYPSVYEAADHVCEVMKHEPMALEGIDRRLVQDMRRNDLHPDSIALLPEGDGWLLAEFGGSDHDEACAKARAMVEALDGLDDPPNTCVLEDPEEAEKIWTVREAGLGATAHVPGEPLTWEGWEDSAVPPERLGTYLRELRELFQRYGYGCDLYGHFGEGCVHTRIDFDLFSAPGVAKFRRFVEEGARLVVKHGGSVSGEHGDGQSKAELLPLMFGEELVEAFARFKRIWDPDNLLNPGRVVDARPLDADLRLGPAYRPRELPTRLAFPEDQENFSRAALRCVGVGECRKDSGVMCPSFMATREEKHSTRGRARLLHEMAAGDVLTRGWREEAVNEALSLCLSCKACKTECPVAVDMADYKAEFMHQYHRHRWRPLHAHVFGRIDRFARLAMVAPRAANALARFPPVRGLLRKMLDLTSQRDLPRFAERSFGEWFQSRVSTLEPTAPEVLLWPDTFTRYFQPEVGEAAVEVLEASGHRVVVPDTPLCCGRPLYEFGLLDQAEAYLRRTIDTLAEYIERGTPIVVLEPACLSVFKEELLRVLPLDEHARRLSRQAMSFDGFLEEHGQVDWAERAGRALVHPHCHQRAINGVQPAHRLLRKAGFTLELPDSGCCGMAGAFGHAREKYEVSMQCAERRLLPAVRDADDDTLVVSDGYSCREQIAHGSDRRPVHLAQALHTRLPPKGDHR